MILARFQPFVILFVLSLLTAPNATGDDSWPQFRGPTGQGIARATDLPLRWSETENVVWKTPIVGRGWSSPVVLGDQIWLTTATEREASPELRKETLVGNKMARQLTVAQSVTLRAVCIDRNTGRTLHDVKLGVVENPPPIHSLNSFASPTAVVEQGSVYCHFGSLGTWRLDTNTGQVVWRRVFPSQHYVGAGSSPVVVDDLLILVCDGADLQYVVAVDKNSGENVWKKDRPPIDATDGDRRKAFSTPLLIEVAGQRQLVAPGAQWVVAYQPETGEEIWRTDYVSGFSNVPRPVYGRGKVFICTGFMRPELWSIRPDGRGDVTRTHVVWKDRGQIPAKSSPLLVDDLLYVIHDRGVATCFQADDGAQVYRKRIGGNFSASPLLADGRIYVFSHEGVTTVFQPGREYHELATSELDGRIMATPAVVDNTILLRTDTHLYCLKEQGRSE